MDCRRCGACCSGTPFSDSIADLVTERDYDLARALPRSTQRRVFVRVGADGQLATGTKVDRHGNFVCAALRGAVNNGETPSRCSCSIYDQRPSVCQKFRVGGTFCQGARMDVGLARVS